MRCIKQTLVLAGIGLLDLVSTLWFLHRHGAAEANPLMAYFLAKGTLAFALAKFGFLAVPLAVLEWAGRRQPAFVRRAANIAIISYVTLYFWGVARINVVPSPSGTSPQLQAAWAEIERNIREKRLRRYALGKSSPSFILGFGTFYREPNVTGFDSRGINDRGDVVGSLAQGFSATPGGTAVLMRACCAASLWIRAKAGTSPRPPTPSLPQPTNRLLELTHITTEVAETDNPSVGTGRFPNRSRSPPSMCQLVDRLLIVLHSAQTWIPRPLRSVYMNGRWSGL